VPFLRLLLAALTILLLPAAAAAQAEQAPIRFLLTFDDGPAWAPYFNPTVRVLETLEKNPYQDNIKAVFFIQTRAWSGGGTENGRALIRREHAEGHVVALHSATTFHSNHRNMGREKLDASLQLGVDDLVAETGVAPKLVRPPFWAYDADTLESYHAHGLRMLLTDLSANDGVIYVFNMSFRKRSNMLKMLAETRKRWAAGEMPVVDGVTPVVVTFHDVNRYTASHMEEYLGILLDVARELEVPLSDKPFYDSRDELERAALAATVDTPQSAPPLPGFWQWMWKQ